jgi:hypothetical protein
MIKKSEIIFKVILIISSFLIISPNVTLALEKTANYTNQKPTEYWPIAPVGGINHHSLKEPLYKQSKKVWSDLPYTDTDIKLKELKGFLKKTKTII